MIVVRELFMAKPGMASKLATMFKEEMAKEGMGRKFRIMTDMVGTYNTVVVEMEYENLAAFEQGMQEYMSRPREKPDPSKPNYHDMFTGGKREVFKIW